MLIIMKCLNEQFAVDRCISDFHDLDFVDRIIVVDGGSTDYTIQELLKFKKVEIFHHFWDDNYHDMEVCQSNIALSYIPNGKLAFILDFDEKMSDDLKKYLSTVNISEGHIRNISRKTVDVFRYKDSPHAIIGDNGWPLISHQIGQYPDYQNRLFRKTFKMRWVNSPHHVMIGYDGAENVDADIIHYEKDDYRNRINIERKWVRAQVRRRELGLTADIFECDVKPEVAEYAEVEAWRRK